MIGLGRQPHKLTESRCLLSSESSLNEFHVSHEDAQITNSILSWETELAAPGDITYDVRDETCGSLHHGAVVVVGTALR